MWLEGGGVAGGEPQTAQEAFFFFCKAGDQGLCGLMIQPSLVITVMPLYFPPVHVGIMGWEE